MVDVRSIQRPIKDTHRNDPKTVRVTIPAQADETAETATPLACSLDLGQAIDTAEAHQGVIGTCLAACSGDLLLGALTSCAQITSQMVATGCIVAQHTEA